MLNLDIFNLNIISNYIYYIYSICYIEFGVPPVIVSAGPDQIISEDFCGQ